MPVQRVLTIAIWGSAVALTLNAIRLTAGLSAARSEPPPTATTAFTGRLSVTPYTIFIDPPSSGTIGGSPAHVTLMTAVRSDGSQARRYDALHIKSPVSSRLLVFTSGEVVTTDDVRGEKTVLGREADIRLRLRDPRSDCLNNLAGTPFAAGEAIKGKELILGYEAVRIRSSGTQLWLAPALGCAQLKLIGTHPSGGLIEQVTTRVIPGEPATEVFDIPARYKEVPRRSR